MSRHVANRAQAFSMSYKGPRRLRATWNATCSCNGGGFEADTELVIKIAKADFFNAIDTMACMKVLERGNSEEAIRELSRTGAGRAAMLIRKALFERLLLTVERAFDPVRKGDLHTAVAFKLLNDPAVFNDVAERGSRSQLELATRIWGRYLVDPRRKQLRHYRNKVVAHISERDPKIAAPLIRDLLVSHRVWWISGRGWLKEPVWLQ
jgi:hypothetical protein